MTTPTLEAERAAPELLPCPFCSSATADAIENQTYGGYMVMCNDCTADGGLRETRAEAIAAWNRRTAAPVAEDVALPPLLDALCRDDTEHDVDYYTAEQVRQAQREAYELGRKAAGQECVKTAETRTDADSQPLLKSAHPAQSIDTPELRKLLHAMGAATGIPYHYNQLTAYIDGRTAGTTPAAKPIAWARKWHADGEKPAKARNGNGRMAWPQKFKFHAIAPHKIFPDDVPLAAAPSPLPPKGEA